jgi:hypothetical protein
MWGHEKAGAASALDKRRDIGDIREPRTRCKPLPRISREGAAVMADVFLTCLT